MWPINIDKNRGTNAAKIDKNRFTNMILAPGSAIAAKIDFAASGPDLEHNLVLNTENSELRL
jgi:hypothetical protein